MIRCSNIKSIYDILVSSGKFYPLIIFIIALGVKLISFHVSKTPFHTDGAEYHNLAIILVKHHAYSFDPIGKEPAAYREPGYPFFLAACYSLWDLLGGQLTLVSNEEISMNQLNRFYPEMDFIRYFQILISCISCIFFYLTLRYVFKEEFSFFVVAGYILFSAIALFPADLQLLRESVQTSIAIVSSYYFAKFIYFKKHSAFIIFSFLNAILVLILKVAVVFPFFIFIFIWLKFKNFRKSLVYSFIAGIIIIVLSLPWLIRTYHYYPDPRTFLSWGTTLTFEKMAYFHVSTDLKELGGQNNPDIGQDKELFPAGIKETFDKTFNGYYKQQTAKVKDAILKIDPSYFNTKPYKLFIFSLKSFIYKSIIEFKHEDIILNPVKIRFFQILSFTIGFLFFIGIALGSYKYYYLFIGNLSYLFLYFGLPFMYASNYDRHFLPVYPFFIFSIGIGIYILANSLKGSKEGERQSLVKRFFSDSNFKKITN